MTKQMIARLNRKREVGCLYYVKSGEDGRLEIWKVEMKRGGKKKNEQQN